MPTPRYDWVLFDADGTLFDFEHAQTSALEKTVTALGVDFTDELLATYTAISEALWRGLETGDTTPEGIKTARFERLLAALGVDGDPVEVGRTYLDHLGREARLLPEAEWVVERLGARVHLLLATNGFSEVQRRRLAASPLAESFRHVVISEEVGHAKPHAGFFAEVFRRTGDASRSRILMVGDSPTSDIQGGHDAGIDTCWLDLGRSGPRPVAEPTYTIERLGELVGIVGIG